MKKALAAVLAACILLLAGCAAPHAPIALQTPMPTLEPTPLPTATPAPLPQTIFDTVAPHASYSRYVLPASLRAVDTFSTALYKMVVDAASAGEATVDLAQITGTAISDEQVDNVRSYILSRGMFKYLSDISLKDKVLTLKYTTEDTAAITQSVESFDKAAQEILSIVNQEGMTYLKCAMKLYQTLSQTVEYSYETMDDGLYGAIVDKKAVAEGYAYAFAYILDQIGLDNTLAFAPDKSHAWNLITIGDASYHIDATFAASLTNGQSLKFFGMDDATCAQVLGFGTWTCADSVSEQPVHLCTDTRFAALLQANRSDVDYTNNAVYLDSLNGMPALARMDLASGQIEPILQESTGGLAVKDGMVYYILDSDGLMYTLNIETDETTNILEGTKIESLIRRDSVLYYTTEGSAETQQIA